MRLRGYMTALFMVCASTPFAIAQSGMNAAIDDPYVPRLADIMSIVQLRHMKLWFAGSSPNWNLRRTSSSAQGQPGGCRVAVSGHSGDECHDNGGARSVHRRGDRGKRQPKVRDRIRRSDSRMQRLPSVDRTQLHCHAGYRRHRPSAIRFFRRRQNRRGDVINYWTRSTERLGANALSGCALP